MAIKKLHHFIWHLKKLVFLCSAKIKGYVSEKTGTDNFGKFF